MSVLERLPAWATTGIGSLPHAGERHAAMHGARAYELPFCPQLPSVEGDMIAAWAGAEPERRAWEPFVGELRRRPPAHGVVKLQVTGPLTLARALGLSAPSAVAARLAAAVAEQVATVRELGLTPVLVIDEPALAGLAAPDVDAAWGPLRAVAPCWGLHVCCPVPWALVEAARPDLLSFDLTLGLDAGAVAALRRLLGGGSRIAWGVVAPHEPDGDERAEALLRDALHATGATGEQSLVTATCGTGLVDERREEAVVARLGALVRAVRSIGRGI